MIIAPEPVAVHSISMVPLPRYPTPSRYGKTSPPWGLSSLREVMSDEGGVFPSLQTVELVEPGDISTVEDVSVEDGTTAEDVSDEQKGQHVRFCICVLIGPHFSCRSYSSLNFINDE